MKKSNAKLIVGGLSKTSKMPGYSYGLPAPECKTGSKLRNNPDSVCFHCYAMKGCYTWPVVRNAQYNRLESVLNNDSWTSAMITLIKGQEYFRWHDSGDIQNMKHLRDIVAIVNATPDTKHWLPTKEVTMIRGYLKIYGEFPENLNVRVSSPNVDQKPLNIGGCNTSTVLMDKPGWGHICPSKDQEGECKDCRACWDRDVKNVNYPIH